MSPSEREAVHALLGAFAQLSLAAELVTIVLPPDTLSPAIAHPLSTLDAERKNALSKAEAAINALRSEVVPTLLPEAAP